MFSICVLTYSHLFSSVLTLFVELKCYKKQISNKRYILLHGEMKNTMVKNELFHKGEIFTVGNGERNICILEFGMKYIIYYHKGRAGEKGLLTCFCYLHFQFYMAWPVLLSA